MEKIYENQSSDPLEINEPCAFINLHVYTIAKCTVAFQNPNIIETLTFPS